MYEIVNFAGNISIVLGLIVCFCAFLLPGGVGTSRGYMIMAFGLAIIMCGALPANDGTGRSVSQHALSWLLNR